MGSGVSTAVRQEPVAEQRQPEQPRFVQCTPICTRCAGRTVRENPGCIRCIDKDVYTSDQIVQLVLRVLNQVTQKRCGSGPLCSVCNLPSFYRIDDHPVFVHCMCIPSEADESDCGKFMRDLNRRRQ
jgi:hypothetical protein